MFGSAVCRSRSAWKGTVNELSEVLDVADTPCQVHTLWLFLTYESRLPRTHLSTRKPEHAPSYQTSLGKCCIPAESV